MANRTYIRDTIQVTQALLSRLTETVAPGESLTLLARELRIAETVTLHDRDLTIVADIFDGRDGIVFLSVPDASGTPGDGDGQNGVPGRTLRVLSRTLRGASLATRGGNGQPGAKGQPGVDGTDFVPEDHSVSPPQDFEPATPGGDGKRGRRGGHGGNGGPIVLNFVVAPQPGEGGVTLLSQGGDGGAGGPGGDPGRGGKMNQQGTAFMPDGEPGPNGPSGTDGLTTNPAPLPITDVTEGSLCAT